MSVEIGRPVRISPVHDRSPRGGPFYPGGGSGPPPVALPLQPPAPRLPVAPPGPHPPGYEYPIAIMTPTQGLLGTYTPETTALQRR